MKYPVYLIAICLLFLSINNCFAQKESNNWYFGSTAGVTFSSGSPVAVTNGAMTAIEGCAAISDSAGNLLFYTDGETVWDRNHSPMPNGNGTLNGGNNATQNAIIVPKPNDLTRFYVFTIDADGLTNGLSYSEVDITANGGFGDVSSLNTQLVTPTAEKVTAIKHYNLRDYWVVTHKWNSTDFDAFIITPSGVNPVPVTTSIGSTHGGATTVNSHGYMKASSDGSKIGLAITGPNSANTKAEVFDFNNSTGVLSNAISLSGFAFTVYGVEFSPDSRLLYVSTSSNPVNIHQFDLYAGSAAQVNLSGQVPVATFNGFVYALQLGLDKKIYGSRFNQPFLAEIANPNVIGAGCNFTANAVSLAGRIAQGGLPNFIQSDFIYADFNYADTCFNDTTQFNLEFTGADSVRWYFDDPASGNNTSTLDTAYHVFSAPGNYNVSVVVHLRFLTDSVTKTVHVLPLPQVNLGVDTTFCDGLTINLDASPSGATSYLWQDNSSLNHFLVDTTGTYFVTATLNGCVGRDTVQVTVDSVPVVNIGADSTVCDGTTPYILNALVTGVASYLWHDGSTASSYNVLTSGTYTVTVTKNNCSATDQAQITVNTSPQVNLGIDTAFCDGLSLNLNANFPGGTTYLWHDNSALNNFLVDTTGIYFVVATLNNCTASDTITVTVNPLPIVSIHDTTICDLATPYTLNTSLPGSTTYLWHDGSTASTYTVLQTGFYTVTVTQNNCSTVKQAHVIVNTSPHVNLGIDTTICEGAYVDLYAGTAFGITYLWQDNSTLNTLHVDTSGTYSVVATLNGCTDSDTIIVYHQLPPIVNIGRDTTLCEGIPFQLTAQNSPATYLWQNGSTAQSITITQTALYIVTVTQNNCIGRDTAIVNISDAPNVSLGNDTILCEGFQLFFNVSNPSSNYQWNDGYTGSTRFVDTLGAYAVTVTNTDGCSASDAVYIDLQFEPEIFLGEDTSLCLGQPLKLDATNYGAVYQWQDNSTGATFNPIFTAIYGVSASNQCGIANDSISIEFRDCNCLVYIPKTFTPNADNKNDVYNYKYDCSEFKVRLRIWNRIGQLMFETENPDIGWDGKYNGKPATEGIYVYQLNYSGYNDRKLDAKTERGTFLLLR